jgi:hypothetical protein
MSQGAKLKLFQTVLRSQLKLTVAFELEVLATESVVEIDTVPNFTLALTPIISCPTIILSRGITILAQSFIPSQVNSKSGEDTGSANFAESEFFAVSLVTLAPFFQTSLVPDLIHLKL